jgi:hypothetical protein
MIEVGVGSDESRPPRNLSGHGGLHDIEYFVYVAARSSCPSEDAAMDLDPCLLQYLELRLYA